MKIVYSEGDYNLEYKSTSTIKDKPFEDLLNNKKRWKIQLCILGGDKAGRTSLLKDFERHFSVAAGDEGTSKSAKSDYATKTIALPYADE